MKLLRYESRFVNQNRKKRFVCSEVLSYYTLAINTPMWTMIPQNSNIQNIFVQIYNK
ncbi:hypothetical protein RhiirA4_482508 [Rhizophagus irregularis]|uniref:Uncharacterized protein n=1 Tax=Rhizophagus irregularis TaxID=588596 RepID=A0A2I1HL69_9GLOM|nr:hypothetical protein RhiirA4_482508 [Rhizophagus irregularis]